jgi:hypothetical protein
MGFGTTGCSYSAGDEDMIAVSIENRNATDKEGTKNNNNICWLVVKRARSRAKTRSKKKERKRERTKVSKTPFLIKS